MKLPVRIVEDGYYKGDIAIADSEHRIIAHFMPNEKEIAQKFVDFVNEERCEA